MVFSDHLDLPLAGIVKEKRFHGEKVISTSYWGDHHTLTFEDSVILFQVSADKSRLHAKASHGKQFAPPYVENWITESLIFITARVIYPRMVIRRFEKDALVFIRATPKNTKSGMPPPFFSTQQTKNLLWEAFCAYLSKCKSMQRFEFLELTSGFCGLCLASKGTLQGFLISLSIFIEFCVNMIFSSRESKNAEEDEYKKEVEGLSQYINQWVGSNKIKERAKGLLSMLNTPDLSNRMDILIKEGVITEKQKQIWKKVKPYLAHGNVIDFKKEEEFWQFRNYFISMVYRLILRIIGFKGLVLDYNGSDFSHIPYEWRNCPNNHCT